MSLPYLVQTGCLALVAGLVLVAASRDLRSLTIPNWVPATIMGVFLAWAPVAALEGRATVMGLASMVGVAVCVFGIGAIAFARGMLGGGDVKLLASVSLFAGPALLGELLLVTALAGGVLGVVQLAAAATGRVILQGETGGDSAGRRLGAPVAYGPAISIGALWIVFLRMASG